MQSHSTQHTYVPVIVVKLLLHPLLHRPTVEQYLCPILQAQYNVLIRLIHNNSMLGKNAGGGGRKGGARLTKVLDCN